MLRKCANPTCKAIFRRLSEGHVFVNELEIGLPRKAWESPLRERQYFWLCGPCSQRLTLALGEGQHIHVVALPEPRPQAVTKSASDSVTSFATRVPTLVEGRSMPSRKVR